MIIVLLKVLMPLLVTDLYDICRACVEGKLKDIAVEFHTDKSALAIVLVSGGYPGKYPKGNQISGKV